MSAEDLSEFIRSEDLNQALRNLTNRVDIQLLGNPEINRATKTIEGFLSLVLRVRVNFCYRDDKRRRSAVLVVKCMPKAGVQLDIVKKAKVFSREGLFFDKILPILRMVSAGKVEIPLPTCYHSIYGGDNDVLYMEDLAASGHRTPDPKYRVQGLDFEHCSLAMKNYGKLHALTVSAEKLLPDKKKWIEEFPELKSDPIIYSSEMGEAPLFKEFVDEGIETVLWVAKQLDGLPKEAEASGKLSSVLQNTWDVMCKLMEFNPQGRYVLTHGDCWMNNLMFRYETASDVNDKPVGVKFIDLQVTRYCHPCLDLLYCIFSSTRKCFRAKHLEELISIYYNSFVENLKVLNNSSPLFTLDEFRSDMLEVYYAFGHYYEMLFVPMMALGEDFAPTKAEDMTPEKYDELLSTGNSTTVRDRYSSDPHYRAIMNDFVSGFVDSIFPDGLDSPPSTLFIA